MFSLLRDQGYFIIEGARKTDIIFRDDSVFAFTFYKALGVQKMDEGAG